MSQLIPFTPKTNYQPTQLDELLYTIKSAARILQVPEEEIASLTPSPEKCLVEFNNKPWQALIPQREFLNQFISDRRASSRSLMPTQQINKGRKWTVWNETDDSRYEVTLSSEKVQCNCPDWRQQAEAFGHELVCCQHCYSVLAQLKYTSLKDYLKAWQPGGKLAKMQITLNQRRRRTIKT